MEPLDPAVSAIHRAALFLNERIAGAAEQAAGPEEHYARDVGAERLSRWRQVIGGEEGLDARIAAAGWSPADVAVVLADRGEPFGPIRDMPEWLRILQRAMAMSPWSERGTFPDLPFGDLLAPFIATGREMLRARCPIGLRKLGEHPAWSLERALGESIADIIGPCLLSEFAADRPAGAGLLAILVADLVTSVGDERYRAFVERHRADHLREMLVKYPVAGRLVATRIKAWVEATAEFIERLQDDLPEIAACLLRLPEGDAVVVEIESRLSDPHDHGRSVSIVEFSDGSRVVYKPRSLAPEAAWQAFVSELGGRHAMLAATVVDRGAYGWMEYVARRDVEDADDVRAFYRSAGSLLCLARAFSLKDLHFENVVAAGCRPVPIDLETIAQPGTRTHAATTLDRITAGREAILDDTVWATEALPARHSLSDRPPMDISAFADMSAASRRRPVWRGLGTDAIALSFEEDPIPSANLPRLNGTVTAATPFVDEIVAGFEESWTALVHGREALAGVGGLLEGIAGIPVRFIARPTEIYYRVLARASDPEKLRNGLDYSIELEAIHQAAGMTDVPPGLRRVAEAELEALHRGDIPRFAVAAGETGVFDSGCLLAADLVDRSGVAAIRLRLDNMTPEQLDLERDIIRASFGAARSGGILSAPAAIDLGSARPLSPDEALDEAIHIGRSVANAARRRPNGEPAWIGVAYETSIAGPAVVALDEGLYQGTTGIAVFLAALHRATGDRRWADLAESALNDARRLARETPAGETAATVKQLGLGLGGIGGLVYGLTLAGDLLGSKPIVDDAVRLASWIDPTAVESEDDLLGGSIGAVPGLLALHGRGAMAGSRDAIEACCRPMRADISLAGVDGYGHGQAGAVATRALAGDFSNSMPLQVEPLMRCVDSSSPDGPVGWCKGPIGHALGRFALRARLAAVRASDIAELDRAVDVAIAAPLALDQLCCGLFGGVEALLVASRHGRGDLAEKAGVLARALISRARGEGGFRLLAGLPAGIGNAGLFQGTSGIGYTLLRLARPQIFPSILTTEWRP